jgi:hypothetical protein
MRKYGPLTAKDAIKKDVPCPACGKHFRQGDYITLVTIGPGDDEEEQEKCRQGRPYNAVCALVHWGCAGGKDENL